MALKNTASWARKEHTLAWDITGGWRFVPHATQKKSDFLSPTASYTNEQSTCSFSSSWQGNLGQLVSFQPHHQGLPKQLSSLAQPSPGSYTPEAGPHTSAHGTAFSPVTQVQSTLEGLPQIQSPHPQTSPHPAPSLESPPTQPDLISLLYLLSF